MSYSAPINDMLFNLQFLAEIEKITQLPDFKDVDIETARAVLEESAKFGAGVLMPLNAVGDKQLPVLNEGCVLSTPGFKGAFAQFVEAGWQGLQHPCEYGGQGLPKVIAAACIEMQNAANLSFALCPLLSDGAVEALLVAGSDTLKAIYLPNLISGKWTGTMNLTEPQAGSDLAAVRCRAQLHGDGSYRVFGTKIFITWGEHDMAENIVHLVLARAQGAPEGVKGLSLFIVPKFLVQADGSLGERNDVYCISLEHKLGIKASPTAVLEYGRHGAGAVAYLVGEENRGLEYMFIMMNAARYSVGVQGIAIAECAYQKAVQFAQQRVQGTPVGVSVRAQMPIIHHPDVRRMLMTMRSYIEGCRALACVTAAAYDTAHHHVDTHMRAAHQAFYEFVVPLIKGFSTEVSLEVVSLALQVHGGMGFIEETGIAQYYRDARILTIYEGTTAIQANDFVGRKIVRDGGQTARVITERIRATEDMLRRSASPHAVVVAQRLHMACDAFVDVLSFINNHAKSNPAAVFAGSVPTLMLAGNLMVGWQLARALLVAQDAIEKGNNVEFMNAKAITVRFYADHHLVKTSALRDSIVEGSHSVTELKVEAFNLNV